MPALLQKSQKLNLTTNSLHNVVISTASDSLYYEVKTPSWDDANTKISKLDIKTREYEIIAELQNLESKPISIRLRGEQYRPATEFLRVDREVDKVNDFGSARFRGKDGKHYEWREKDHHLEVFIVVIYVTEQVFKFPKLARVGAAQGSSSEAEANPCVAVYHKPKRYLLVLRMARQAYLEVDQSCLEAIDTIIVSFLLAERKRRDQKTQKAQKGKRKESPHMNE